NGADQTPHQVWGKARADWELTRLATSGELGNVSPFSGTHLGEVMAQREASRAERFSEFFTLTQIPPKKKRTPAPAPDVSGKDATEVATLPQDEEKAAEAAVAALEEPRRV